MRRCEDYVGLVCSDLDFLNIVRSDIKAAYLASIRGLLEVTSTKTVLDQGLIYKIVGKHIFRYEKNFSARVLQQVSGKQEEIEEFVRYWKR